MDSRTKAKIDQFAVYIKTSLTVKTLVSLPYRYTRTDKTTINQGTLKAKKEVYFNFVLFSWSINMTGKFMKTYLH